MKLRELFCRHREMLNKTDGKRWFLECLACGKQTQGILTGCTVAEPIARLVSKYENAVGVNGDLARSLIAMDTPTRPRPVATVQALEPDEMTLALADAYAEMYMERIGDLTAAGIAVRYDA